MKMEDRCVSCGAVIPKELQVCPECLNPVRKETERMWDGKSNASLCNEIWIIRHKETDETVFEYRTYQGNKKKAFFNSFKYAEQSLNKYIKNPEDYYILRV